VGNWPKIAFGGGLGIGISKSPSSATGGLGRWTRGFYRWIGTDQLRKLECVILLCDSLMLVTPGIVACSIINCSNLCIACYIWAFSYYNIARFENLWHLRWPSIATAMPYWDLHPVDTPLLIATVRDSDEAAGNLVMFGAHHVTRKRYARLLFDLVSDIKHGFLSSSDAGLLLVQLRHTASEWGGKVAGPLHVYRITEDTVITV